MSKLYREISVRVLLAVVVAIAGISGLAGSAAGEEGEQVRAVVKLSLSNDASDAIEMQWSLVNSETGVAAVDTSGVVPVPGNVIDMPVEPGIYEFSLSPGPKYQPISYEMDFTVEGSRADGDGYLAVYAFTLQPVAEEGETLYSNVRMVLSSTDPEAGYTLPEGSTWTVTRTSGDSSPIAQGVFTADQRSMMEPVYLDTPVPYGEYLVSINGLPVFQAYEQVHWAASTDDVWLVKLVPQAPDEALGTVSITVWECEGVDEVLWDSGPGQKCDYSAGNFIFYPVGDDSGDFESLWADPTASIDLPVGAWEVYQEGYPDTHTTVDVRFGETTSLQVVNPQASNTVPTTALGVLMEDGSEIDGVEIAWTIDSAATGDRVMEDSAIYNVPATLFTGELVPGVYDIVINAPAFGVIESWITVTDEGPNDFAFALNGGEAPDDGEGDGGDIPDGDTGETPGDGNTGADQSDTARQQGSVVTGLPRTGAGHASSSMSMALMLTAAAAMTAVAGGLVVRQKRG